MDESDGWVGSGRVGDLIAPVIGAVDGRTVFVAMWDGKQVLVSADSSYAAQVAATAEFQKAAGRRRVKSYDVIVMVARRADGSEVVHVADF